MNLNQLSIKSGINKLKLIEIRKFLQENNGYKEFDFDKQIELLQQVEGFLGFLETHGHSIREK